MKEIEIIDNFLDKDLFENLKKYIINDYFPWFFNDYKTKEGDKHFQFTHTCYKDHNIKSHEFHNKLINVYNKLNFKSILRVKANLTTRENKIFTYDFHNDMPFECKTSIFYINTNNGKTIFENGNKIESIENRMITFPSQLLHSGTSHTDEKVRIVINFNYF
jgi:hypothetical protein